MKLITFVRWFLLVLIIIGIGLLLTQKMWVPKLVNSIIESESTK
jgi:TM2 domain-containing membrane protein YozV